MLAAATVENRLNTTGGQHGARPRLDHRLQPACPCLLRHTAFELADRRTGQRAGVARVGDDDRMLDRNRVQEVGDRHVGDPVRIAVGLGIHRKPVAAQVGPVDLAVTRVIDQQVVLVGEFGSQAVEFGQDLVARRVGQQGHLEAVLLAQQLGHGLGVLDRGLQLRQQAIILVADHQSVEATEFHRAQVLGRLRRRRHFGATIGHQHEFDVGLLALAIDRHQTHRRLFAQQGHLGLEQPQLVGRQTEIVDRERQQAGRRRHLADDLALLDAATDANLRRPASQHHRGVDQLDARRRQRHFRLTGTFLPIACLELHQLLAVVARLALDPGDLVALPGEFVLPQLELGLGLLQFGLGSGVVCTLLPGELSLQFGHPLLVFGSAGAPGLEFALALGQSRAGDVELLAERCRGAFEGAQLILGLGQIGGQQRHLVCALSKLCLARLQTLAQAIHQRLPPFVLGLANALLQRLQFAAGVAPLPLQGLAGLVQLLPCRFEFLPQALDFAGALSVVAGVERDRIAEPGGLSIERDCLGRIAFDAEALFIQVTEIDAGTRETLVGRSAIPARRGTIVGPCFTDTALIDFADVGLGFGVALLSLRHPHLQRAVEVGTVIDDVFAAAQCAFRRIELGRTPCAEVGHLGAEPSDLAGQQAIDDHQVLDGLHCGSTDAVGSVRGRNENRRQQRETECAQTSGNCLIDRFHRCLHIAMDAAASAIAA